MTTWQEKLGTLSRKFKYWVDVNSNVPSLPVQKELMGQGWKFETTLPDALVPYPSYVFTQITSPEGRPTQGNRDVFDRYETALRAAAKQVHGIK